VTATPSEKAALCPRFTGFDDRKGEPILSRIIKPDEWEREAFEQFPDAVMVLDNDCVVRSVNRRACELLESPPDEVRGKPCSDVCLCDRGKQHCFLRRLIATGEQLSEGEMRTVNASGKILSMVVTATPLRDKNNTIIGGMEILRDISVFGDAARDMQKLAETDDLTGLSRRHVLFHSLHKEAARRERHGHPFSVMMIDVDDFKSYNDTFGHPAGDELLRVISDVLRDEARGEDTVARYGGEEFVYLSAQTDSQGAKAVSERILTRVRESTQSVTPDGKPRTISIGIASCDGDRLCDPNVMIKSADDALYTAKHAGKNRIAIAERLGE